MIIEVDGQRFDVPDDATPEEIDALTAPAPSVSKPEAIARGVGQGGTLGLGEELMGLYRALGPKGGSGQDFANDAPIVEPTPGATLLERYRGARDAERAENDAARQAQPLAFGAAEFGGAMLAPLGVAGRVKEAVRAPSLGQTLLQAARAAGGGATLGVGYSRADATRGDLGGLARDASGGAGVGLAGYGLGRALGSLAGRRIRKADQGIASAQDKIAEKSTARASDELASEIGTLGAESQKLNRQIEWVIRLADEEASGKITPENLARLNAFRQTPAYATVVNKAAERVLEQAPAAAQSVAAQEAKVAAMRAGLPQRTAELADEMSKSSVGADLRSLFKSYGEPAVAAGVGGALLGAPGAAAAGLMAGRTRMGKAVMDRIKKPGNQLFLNQWRKARAEKLRDVTVPRLRRMLAGGYAVAADDEDE